MTNLISSLLPDGTKRRDVTELHVHLGGSVPIYRLWEMGIARGIRGMGHSYDKFIQTIRRTKENSGDLDKYLEIFDLVELIQAGPQAIAECVRIAINGAFRTGGMRHLGPGGEGGDPKPAFAITQLELRFNPMKRTGLHMSKGGLSGLFDVDRVVKAACESAEESEIAYRNGIRTGLIICFGRDLSWDVNRTLAEKIPGWVESHKNIVGIDLAGPESVMSFANEKDLDSMAELFAIVPPQLGRTLHLGETRHVSVDSFVRTVKRLQPHRVSHPVMAIRGFWEEKDARALEILAERKITCELCVYSNFLTGAVTTPEEYGKMLSTFDQFGIEYTFSTDNPALQLSTLASELEYLLQTGAATPEQIERALQNADQSTFLNRLSAEKNVSATESVKGSRRK
jgi:adenosine deaminase